jgi:hypothetical protein
MTNHCRDEIKNYTDKCMKRYIKLSIIKYCTEEILDVFERKILRWIFGPTQDEKGWKIL